jgi:hypothetical protein
MEIPKRCKKGKRQAARQQTSNQLAEAVDPAEPAAGPRTKEECLAVPSRMVTRGGAWRAEVDARIGELEDRLTAVCDVAANAEKTAGCSGAKIDATCLAEIEGSVRAELDRAVTAANARKGVGANAWWTGSSITRAWEALHNAELVLLQIESDAAVSTAVPRLLAWIERTMDAGRLREGHESALREESERKTGTGAPDRTKVRAALTDVISANARRYAGVRTFRNNLILVMLLLIVVLLGMAIWHAINPQFLPLCRDVAEIKNGNETTTKVCVTGPNARPWDIWILLAVGLFGGVLGIAFGFSETEEAARYDPRTWQTFLKPVTGAATALAAVIFLQSGVAIELTIKGSAAIIGYALLFGFSQQLLTKFVDKRAETLITPTK